MTSDEECGFTTGAEERIQDVLDREITPRARRRTRCRRLSHRSDLESESSTDSDQDRNQDETPSRRQSWKGPRKRGLEELRTAHDDFRHALSYRTYRLQNTDSTQDRDVFANSYMQRRRIEATMRDAKFDGSKPIGALSFLRMFKTQCDKNAISEGAALLLLPDFLIGDAEQIYQNELELGDEGVGGITSYCHAVQFILRRYAADRYIDRAVEEFENVRQKDDEDETAYARRLRSKAKCFGGVYSEADLITRFIRGLDPALKPLLSAECNSGLRSCRTFYDVVDRAACLGDSQRAMMHRATRRRKTTQNLRHRVDRVSSIEPATRSRTERTTPSSSRREDAFILLQEEESSAEAHHLQLPTTSYGTTHRSEISDPSEFKTPQTSFETDIDAVNALYGKQQTYVNDPRDICFKCFAKGRKAPLCPCRDTPDEDPHFGNVAKQNYARLTEKQREWLRSLGQAPRWLVASSGSCPPSFVQDPQKTPANVANKPEQASDKLVSFTPTQKNTAKN